MQIARIVFVTVAAALVVACGSPEERAATYLAKAQALYDAGDITAAKLEARSTLQIEPKNVQARYILAKIGEQEGDFRELFNNLLIVVDLDPDNVAARLQLADLYTLGQVYDQVELQLEALKKLAPQQPEVLVLEGRVKAQKGDQAGAIAAYEAALASKPDYPAAIALLATAYGETDVPRALVSLDAAIPRVAKDDARMLREIRILLLRKDQRLAEVQTAYEDLIRDFPDEVTYREQLARLFADEGRVDDADAVLKSLASRNPAELSPRLSYVAFLGARRGPAAAEAALKTFIEETPEAYELRLTLAELYESDGRVAEARRVVEELATLAPQSPAGLQARGRLAAIQAQAGELDAARAGLASILKEDSDNSQALLVRSAMLINEGNFDDAIADLRVVVRKDETNQNALLLLAQAYFRSGDRVLAADTYRRLLKINPERGEALIQLSAVLVADGDLEGGREILATRVEKKPDDVLASARLVEVLIALKRLDEAESVAQRLAALPNQEGLGDYELGRIQQVRGNLPAAIASYRKALDARPKDPIALETVTEALAAAGRNAEAIPLLLEWRSKQPQLAHPPLLLATAYARAGDVPKARATLDEALKADPGQTRAWLNLARLAGPDPGPQAAVLRRGLAAAPGNPELTLALASELERAGKADEAITVLEQSLKTAGTNTEVLGQRLAALLLDHSKDPASVDRALAMMQPFAQSANPALLDTLGWAYYRKGEFTQASGLLERAVAKGSAAPLYRYHLAMTYLAMGNKAGARQQLQEALSNEQVRFTGLDEARATLATLQAG